MGDGVHSLKKKKKKACKFVSNEHSKTKFESKVKYLNLGKSAKHCIVHGEKDINSQRQRK